MKKVYMSMSTDVIHHGHIRIINRAAQLGELTIGVLSDEAISRYKRFPLLRYEQRAEIIRNLKGVSHVVEQKKLDYTENLLALKPDIVVHGDNWVHGVQEPIRRQVIKVLKSYGGELVEFPYSESEDIAALEADVRRKLSMPEKRRARLRALIGMKPVVRVLEAHNGLSGLIVEETRVQHDGCIEQFDAMWVSSLCDSTIKGKPDIELVDNTSRLNTIDEIMEVTTKPIILDGDTGGKIEHFEFLVKTLERMGVSAVIIEDKEGLKKNSLFGTEVTQQQASIEDFSQKIAAGKSVLTTRDFMIIARIESLILERGMDDALARAFAFAGAGADGIMIHSRQKSPDEIFEFIEKFRARDGSTPLVVVPTTFNAVKEREWGKRGVNIVIYANQLIRSAFPAMEAVARMILQSGRCKEADEQLCMPISQILTLIPGAK
ncbi:MAG: phosphoenolpyruvate mutase [Christensenellales bacterium]|jgi:phosphoenolpyruvate mutase